MSPFTCIQYHDFLRMLIISKISAIKARTSGSVQTQNQESGNVINLNHWILPHTSNRNTWDILAWGLKDHEGGGGTSRLSLLLAQVQAGHERGHEMGHTCRPTPTPAQARCSTNPPLSIKVMRPKADCLPKYHQGIDTPCAGSYRPCWINLATTPLHWGQESDQWSALVLPTTTLKLPLLTWGHVRVSDPKDAEKERCQLPAILSSTVKSKCNLSHLQPTTKRIL